MASRDVRAGRAFVELFVKNNKFIRGLRNAQRRLRDFGSAASAVGRQVAIAGVLMFAPFIAGAAVLTQFSDIMLTVKAVTSATADDFARLTQQAKELGRTTSFTARQVGEMQVVLGRGGFNPTQILDASESILALARATGTDLAESADIAAASLRRFGLDVGQIGMVADVLTAAANNSAQTLSDLGQAMILAGPIADEFGLTIQQTAKAIGVMANFGIKGTMAGTGLRQILLQLSDPAIRQKLANMGVSLEDFGKTMLDIGKVTEDMSGPERLAFLKELFGQRAAGAGAKLGKEAFEQLEEAIDNAGGAAQRTADEMDSGIGGSFRRFMSAVEGGFLAIGESIAEPLKVASEFATVATGLFTKFAEDNPRIVASFAGVALAITATGVALLTMGAMAVIASIGVGALAAAFTAVVGLFTATISPALLLGGAIAALGAGLLFLARNTAPVRAASEVVTGLAGSIRDMVSTVAGDAVAAWGGITAAIQAGDTEAAMAVVTATLKLEWARLVAFWMEKTEGFSTFWTETTFGLASIFTDAVAGIKSAWAETLGFLKKAWDDWKNSTFTEGLAGLLAPVLAAVTPGVSTEQIRETLQEDFARSRSGSEDRKADIDAETAERLRQIEEDRRGTQAALADDLDRATQARRDSITEAEKELELAKQRRDELLKEIEDRAAAGESERGAGGGTGEPGMAGVPGNLGAIMRNRMSTFSTSAAIAMQGGVGARPQERIAKATEKTAKGVQDVFQEQEKLTKQLSVFTTFG